MAGPAKGAAKRRPGRPSSYSELKARAVIRHYEEGGTRFSLDADKTLPSWSTFRRWMEARPELRNQYARALENQADAMFERAMHLAQHATPENAHVVRVQADVFLRCAARRRPKKYFERVIAEEIAAGHRLAAYESRAQERGAAIQAGEQAETAPPQRLVIEVVDGADHTPQTD